MKKNKNKKIKELHEDIPKHTWSSMKRLGKRLSKQKFKMGIIVFSCLLSCLFLTMIPIFMGIAIDNLVEIVQQESYTVPIITLVKEAVLNPVMMIIICSLCNMGLAYIQQYIVASVGENFVKSLRQDISEKITKLPLRYFDSHKTGDILSRTTSDLEKVSDVMQVGLMQFISSLFTIVFTIIAMFLLHPSLTIIVLSSLLLCMIATSFVSRMSQLYFAKNQAILGELNARIEEFYTGNTILKVFNQQEVVTELVLDLNRQQYMAMRKAQFVNYAIYPTIRILNQLGFIVTAFVGGTMALRGTLSLGVIQAFLQYVNQIGEPISSASYVITSLQAAVAGAERVFELLDEVEEEKDIRNELIPDSVFGSVKFQHIKFGYNENAILMKDLNLEVKPNEMVAIVGPTGGGKTTLINLLMRFYETNDGTITIDGVNIRDMKRSTLRSKIGMVLQDTWLFEGSIADNISYSKMDASREEIMEAAKAARCDHFIRTLPNGYDTYISSEDSIVSQGQMQLLTIARAMLANPTIMILDEATSSVDTRTEVEIQKAMNKLMQDKTSFVIAHRLSTIVNADVILVVKDGDIIERGNHISLLKENGFYASLYHSQFA